MTDETAAATATQTSENRADASASQAPAAAATSPGGGKRRRQQQQGPLLPGKRLEAPVFGTDHETLSLEDVFGRAFQGHFVEKQVVLYTQDVRRLVRRDYLYLCRMLYTLTRAWDYRGIDRSKLDLLEKKVADAIDNVRTLVQMRSHDLAKRFNNAPEATVSSKSGRAAAYTAPVASPHAFAYLQLLAEADEFLSHQSAAWLQGLSKNQDHYNRCREVKNALVKIKHTITEARHAAFLMLDAAKSKAEPGSDEAAKLHQEVSEVAAGLIADAKGDTEVMDGLSVSQGHDLEAAAAPRAEPEVALSAAK